MADTNRINVKLDEGVRDRLDHFCIATHRNVTQSVNLLLGAALAMTEAVDDPNTLLDPPPRYAPQPDITRDAAMKLGLGGPKEN